MIVLLADADVNGQIVRLVQRMQKEPWIGFWNDLQMSSVSFADVGLDPADSDAVVWRRCQEKRLILLTSNRNDDGTDSLQNTIQTCNTPQSLPVFTISDAKRVPKDRDYAAEVIWSLFEYSFDLDDLLSARGVFICRNRGTAEHAAMSQKIEIIDRGRGPQLSTSRITVQDVVPMLQRNCTPEEIMEVIPVLNLEDIQVSPA